MVQDNGQDSFQLDVLVTDDGVVAKTATVSVNIVVADANDNAPQFAEKIYTAQIFEDADVGSPVATVSAKDPDKEANGEVVYEAVSSEDRFTVDRDTGVVALALPLDREVRDVYEVVVTARDKGDPVMSSTAKVSLLLSKAPRKTKHITFLFYHYDE